MHGNAVKIVIIVIGVLLGEEIQWEMRIGPLTFMVHDPHNFYDWIVKMDCYFDLYDPSDTQSLIC